MPTYISILGIPGGREYYKEISRIARNKGITTHSRGAERTGAKTEVTRIIIIIEAREPCMIQLRSMGLHGLRRLGLKAEWRTEKIRAAHTLA